MNSINEPKDFRLVDLPKYMEWTKRKLHDGESSEIITHLDETCVWGTEEEVAQLGDDDFNDLLIDLKVGLGLG